MVTNMSKPEFFLWCDLETTGLNPETNSILEMAVVLTDADFNELGKDQFIFSPDLNFALVNEKVREMHTKNGLWNEVINNQSPVTAFRADDEIRHWLEGLTASDWRDWKKVYLAGSSVHFDVGFLYANEFTFINWVSHRYFDVSVFRTALKMWAPSKLWTQNDTHRAMDDILDHIEEAKYYRRIF